MVCTFEYNKVRATSGTPSLGQSIQFSIPQFGDFFHDICCHVLLRQPTLASTATGDGNGPAMRWCDFPGERLLKKVQQEVNGNPLDEYTSHATNMHREFRVTPNKRVGWNRCVGQEVAEAGFVDQPNWDGNGVAASALTSRVAASVHVGAQTPTGQKPVADSGRLELFIPLLFWYNKDVRLAVPSVAIPYGQRFINIELASFTELCGLYPRGNGSWASPGGTLTENASGTLQTIELYINNIFVNPEVHKIYIKRIGFSLIRVHRQQLYNAASTSAEVLLQQLKWPIEYLFVGMKVKDYHAGSTDPLKRQHLDKWHTFHSRSDRSVTTQGHEVMKVSNLFDAGTGTVSIDTAGILTGLTTDTLVETLAVNDVLRINGHLYYVTVVNGNETAGSAATTIQTTTEVTSGAVTGGTGLDVVAATADVQKITYQGLGITSQQCAITMDTITIKAHGIPIYDNFPSEFFNCYTSYHYGGPNLNTPEDCGAYFIPFCLYPGSYQPSGHINVSRAREFYINWDSSVITSGNEGTLVVIASAINDICLKVIVNINGCRQLVITA